MLYMVKVSYIRMNFGTRSFLFEKKNGLSNTNINPNSMSLIETSSYLCLGMKEKKKKKK